MFASARTNEGAACIIDITGQRTFLDLLETSMKPFGTATFAGALVMIAALAGCAVTPPMSRPTAMTARLSAASEAPPGTSVAGGTVDAILNRLTNVFSWTITYAGLSGPVTAGHFHGPAIEERNAGVVLPVTGGLTSPIRGTATLTAAQAADLTAGKWYVNLHTAARPDGEVRGQITVPPCTASQPSGADMGEKAGPTSQIWWLTVDIDLQSPLSDGCYEMRLLARAGPDDATPRRQGPRRARG